MRTLGLRQVASRNFVEQLGILRLASDHGWETRSARRFDPIRSSQDGLRFYASDLIPIACMLTWGAVEYYRAPEFDREGIDAGAVGGSEAKVDREITALGIEHDRDGKSGRKAFLYCLEVQCSANRLDDTARAELGSSAEQGT